jgi:voltage-gated potassium channel
MSSAEKPAAVAANPNPVVLPARWRMVGPLDSIIGVLMCGLSVSLLFAIATRLAGREES